MPRSGCITKVNGAMPVNPIGNADAPIEVDQVCAAAQKHVLAIVEQLTRLWIFKRSCAAAKHAAGFEKCYINPRRLKRDRRRHPGKTPADDDYAWLLDLGCGMFDVRCCLAQRREHRAFNIERRTSKSRSA